MRWIAFPLGVLLLSATLRAEDPATRPALPPAAAAFAARLHQLDSLTATYQEERTFTPAPPPAEVHVSLPPGLVLGKPREGVFVSTISLAFLRTADGPLARIDSRYDPATLRRLTPGGDSPTHSFSEFPDGCETLRQYPEGPRGGFSLTEKINEWSLDVALGLRPMRSNLWLSDELLAQMTFASADGHITATFTEPGKYAHRWTLDPARGNIVTHYQWLDPAGRVVADVTPADFRPVDGVLLPFSATEKRFAPIAPNADEFVLVEEATLMVKAYTLHAKEHTAAAHHIAWPQGTLIVDERKKPPYLYMDEGVLHQINGQDYLRIEQAQRAAATTQP
jgi:hypothetical protein